MGLWVIAVTAELRDANGFSIFFLLKAREFSNALVVWNEREQKIRVAPRLGV